MLILDFTNQNKASNAKKGYFKQWNELFGEWGDYDNDLNDDDDLAKTYTNKGERSFESYFNSLGKLQRKTKWLFGNEDKYIEMEPFDLYLDNDYTGWDNYFLDHVFSLGDAVNYFHLDLEFDDEDMQDLVKNRLKQKGYRTTILGGSKCDNITISTDYDEGHSNVPLNPKSSFIANTMSGKDKIRVFADFRLSAQINSGKGSDVIELKEANSSFINASSNNDTVILRRGSPRSLSEVKIVKNIKDVIIGGAGRDQFIFSQGVDQSSYDLNRSKDFCVIKDFQSVDEIVFYGNDNLRIDGRNGKVKLAATGAYKAQSIGYTARLYADDDLIAYISGAEPSLSDILQFH